jgi:hypothetical protein
VLGRHDEAVALLEDAVEQVRAAQLPVLLMPQELDLVWVLVRRGAPGDAVRVQELCTSIEVRARALGCEGVAAEARLLLAAC